MNQTIDWLGKNRSRVYVRAVALHFFLAAMPTHAYDVEYIDGTSIPVQHTFEVSRADANEWYSKGWCKHVADIRVRAFAALSDWDDYKSLAAVIDRDVPREGGDSFIVNAYGWLQESEDRETLWRPFAEIEVMDCDRENKPHEPGSGAIASQKETIGQHVEALRAAIPTHQVELTVLTSIRYSGHDVDMISKVDYESLRGSNPSAGNSELAAMVTTDLTTNRQSVLASSCLAWAPYFDEDPDLIVHHDVLNDSGNTLFSFQVTRSNCGQD